MSNVSANGLKMIPNILSSKGPVTNYRYRNAPTEYFAPFSIIQHMVDTINVPGNGPQIIFIRNGSTPLTRDLDLFASYIHILKHPVVLITSDGDRPVPSSYSTDTVTTILESNYIVKWYTQNYDQTVQHYKLRHIPIGFDFHTPDLYVNKSLLDKVKCMYNIRNANTVKIRNKIFTDTHHSITHPERKKLRDIVSNCHYFVLSTDRMSFDEITKEYNKYQFVLSPRGSGLDTHRTWEIIFTGSIVITKTSPLDNMFIKHNLPVVILQDWEELTDNLEDKMKQWYDEHIDKTRFDNIDKRLSFQYWVNT